MVKSLDTLHTTGMVPTPFSGTAAALLGATPNYFLKLSQAEFSGREEREDSQCNQEMLFWAAVRERHIFSYSAPHSAPCLFLRVFGHLPSFLANTAISQAYQT